MVLPSPFSPISAMRLARLDPKIQPVEDCGDDCRDTQTSRSQKRSHRGSGRGAGSASGLEKISAPPAETPPGR